MLPRIALRAAIRPAAVPRQAYTIQCIRGYAKHRGPPKPQYFKPGAASDSSRPSQNTTWRPSDGIRFGERSDPSRTTNDAAGDVSQAGEFNPRASPDKNTAPDSQPGPKSTESNPSRTGQDSSEASEEFNPSATPEANTAPSSDPTGAAQEPQGPQRPNKPLPDLRFGIPSTFDAEFGGKKAAPSEAEAESDPLKQEDAKDAEEPAGTASGAGRSTGRDEELPKSAYETSIDRRRNKMANYMYAGFFLAAILGAVYLGRDWDTEEEEKAHPGAPSGWGPGLFYDRVKARISGQMGYYTEPTFPKLLPDMDPAPPHTLVLSLEDLMIHSEWSREHGWRTAKRPGLDYFLRYLSQYYELVIFTSLPMATAEPIIRKLDPFRIVQWPLFREATRYSKGEYIKDLSYLNRPLSQTILIDTKQAHARLQPDNAILLPPWKGDAYDRNLIALIPFLEHVATMGITDVRKAIKSFEGTDIPTEFAAREARAREQFQKKLAEDKAKRPRRVGVGSLSNALGFGMRSPTGELTPSEAYAQGKMYSDLIRERGQKNYEALEKEIRENGEKFLKEMEAEEKKMQEEQMRSMKSGFLASFGAAPAAAASKTGAAAEQGK